MSEFDPLEDRALVSLWLRRLGQGANLSLELNEEGVCGVGHVNGIDCAIEVPGEGGTVYLRAPLAPWPPVQATQVCERFLTASFFGMGTGGASFAIDPRDCELILWQAIPLATLDEASFGEWLLGFIRMAAHWRDQVRSDELLPPAELRMHDDGTGTADIVSRMA